MPQEFDSTGFSVVLKSTIAVNTEKIPSRVLCALSLSGILLAPFQHAFAQSNQDVIGVAGTPHAHC
jgi:hypothetical protein